MTTLTRLALALVAAVLLGVAPTGGDDVDALPAYKPGQVVSGVIRNFGNPLGGLLGVWEKGFARQHPGVTFEDEFPSGDGAVGGLVSGVADLAVSGREPVLTEYEAFYDAFRTDLVEVTVATGTYDTKGTWAPVIVVNAANPISRLTVKQLDGIFGAERTGGYSGFRWIPEAARSSKDDIRTWGQLGLGGEWADKAIQTYGYAFTGATNFFQRRVFGGGEKWNPNYREYVEAGSKMVPTSERGPTVSTDQMLSEISSDRYAIGWTGALQARRFPGVKVIAVADSDGPYVQPSRESIASRSYPLTRSIYVFPKKRGGQPLDPKVREFLRYVLSRDGQEDVGRHNMYMPLTPAAVREQLAKLE
jgi:phosphate transport system substrate-binding protein